jgi:tetratricopeptide (TPR) repeat protein
MKNLAKALVFPMMMIAIAVQAQPGWNWGDQVDIAKEKNAFYVDMLKGGKFTEAIPAHNWLLENTPDLNESLYQNGAKIYEGLVETEKDPAKQETYKAKALEMYDLRIQYFGREAYVMNRKVYPAYKFYKGDKSKYEELFNMFSKAYDLNKEDFYTNNLAAYMDVVRRYKATGGDISDEQVIDIYTQITDVLDVKRAEGKNVAAIDRISDAVDKMLSSTVDLNCDFVESILGPKFEAEPDVKIAKKIFSLMLTGKCTDRPLAFEAARVVNENEPSYGIAKFLAVRAASDGDVTTAMSFYEQALDLTDENIKKAEIYMGMARLEANNGNKVASRSNARKSLAFDPSNKEAYSLIGNLYMGSFDECKGGEKKTHDYAIFIAAHKMFQLAGDSEGMAKAKALFPSIEDIFNDEYAEGDTYQVGCWINETVTLERRPNQ